MTLPGGFGGSVKFLGVLLVLMVAALVFGKKAWDARSHASSASLLKTAREAISRQEWAVAAENIRQAREAEPDGLTLLRVMVEYLDKTGLDPAFQLQALRRLHEAGQSESADLWVAGRASLRSGDVAGARALLEKLPADLQATPEALELKAAILQQEGGDGQARKLQHLAAERTADDPLAAVRAAVLDAESVHSVQRASGMERLWALAARTDKAGLAALRFLVAQPGLTPQQVQELAHKVQAHREAGLADQLAVLSAQLRLEPAQRSSQIGNLVARHQSSSLEVKLVLARWLAAEREHEMLGRLIPWEVMLKSEDLFPIAIQSLAEAGRWQQMSEVLRQHSLPMSEEGLAVWRALAASRLQPDMNEAQVQLKTAIKRAAATGNYGPLRAAAQVAQDLELWELALEGYQLLAQPKAGHELEMLEKCWEAATHLGDSTQLLDTARRQSALRPTSALYAQRLDYLRLLRGEEMESVSSTADGTGTHDILSALKAYRLGDRRQAAELLAAAQGTTALNAGQRAVYAGLLALLGDQARAFQLAEKISPRLLMAEEQVFLQKAL